MEGLCLHGASHSITFPLDACLGGGIPESTFNIYFASKVPFPKDIIILLVEQHIMVRKV